MLSYSCSGDGPNAVGPGGDCPAPTERFGPFERASRSIVLRLYSLLPFANYSRKRWFVVPVAVLIYVPVFFLIHQWIGSVAFGFAFLVAFLVAVIAGIGPGIVTVACLQAANFGLNEMVGRAATHAVASALVAFSANAVFVVVTGGARVVLRRLATINSELDEQIRARKEVESSLAKSLTLHQNLLASLGEGVGLFDSADRFLFANAAAEKLFETESGKLVGRQFADFLTPESVEALKARDAKSRSSKSIYDLRLLGDKPRIILVTETRMAQGTTCELTTLRVLRDVTARAKLEHEKRELDLYLQRTEALQSLAVLAGGVAHDFNNLLSGVIGSTELGLIRLKKSPLTVRPCLEDARRFAIEASDLSRKMLAYAGKRSATLESVSLEEEVFESLLLVSSTIANKASLNNEIPRGLPRVMADRSGLHQVITNLILNAIEAMEDGKRGTLVLSARTESVTSDHSYRRDALAPAPGEYVVLRVTDTGVGMSEETRTRLFEPFFSTKFQGRGMGLAATLGIVRAHQGGITVESKLGFGTTFDVYWPIANSESLAESAVVDFDVITKHHITVLLVDDEAVIRETTNLLLTELGCSVVSARNGREALQVFSKLYHQVDVVLLDLTMPEQSGFDVLHELRGIDPNVCVILTSGYSVYDTVEPFQQANVVGFLPKPHNITSLELILRRGIGKRRSGQNVKRRDHAEPTLES